jgi:signal transduction histidine kinase
MASPKSSTRFGASVIASVRPNVRPFSRSLRGRLTSTYAVALAIVLVIFALATLFAVDSVQRHNLDAELWAVARDEASSLDYSASSQTISSNGATRFQAVAGSRVASALLAQDGHALVASAARVPDAIAHSATSVEETSITTVASDDAKLRTVYVPMTDNGTRGATIAVWSDITPILRLDRKLGLAFALTIPLVVVLAMLVGAEIARRGLAPLDRINSEASEIEARDLSARIGQPDAEELGRLAKALNRMLERLESAFDRERRFTADASHEFRAPLSIIIAESDLMLTDVRSLAEYRRALESIALEAYAMETLTRNLLATARAASLENSRIVAVATADLIRAVVSRVRILADARGVGLQTVSTCDATIYGQFDEFEQALMTVVHNALKHARPNGCVTIGVSIDPNDVAIRVSDDGKGFSEAALVHALDRFWRESRPGNAEGHGLGLPIAKSIVNRFGGEISLANAGPGGATVILTFPRDASPGSDELHRRASSN